MAAAWGAAPVAAVVDEEEEAARREAEVEQWKRWRESLLADLWR